MPTRVAVLFAIALAGCAGGVKDNVVLTPAGEQVEISYGDPGGAYAAFAEVKGEGAGKTLDDATEMARRDLRNKAAEKGASFVSEDQSSAEAIHLRDRVKVILVGRAFKARE